MRLLRLALGLLCFPAFAQTWNSNAGGYNTGYGTVYGSFGLAMATQQMYQTSQLAMQRAMARQAMINKFGLAAVEKAEREAAAGKKTPTGPQVAEAPPAPKNFGRFKPEKSLTVAKQVSEALGSSAEEKKMIGELIKATKQAFEAQPETQAWRNNVAGALAFFMITTVTVANDAAEPSDAATEAVFQAFNQTLDATPDFAKATNKEKAQLYETLIAFTSLPLAIYADAKERNDAAQLAQAKEIAANLLQLVLKVDAAKVQLPK